MRKWFGVSYMKYIIQYALLVLFGLMLASCATADVERDTTGGRLDDQVPDAPEDDTVVSDMGQDLPVDAGDAANDPVVDGPSDPVVDPRPDPVVDPQPDPVTDPTSDPVVEPDMGRDPTSDPIPDPIEEPDVADDPDLPTGGGLFISEICDHKSHPGASFIEIYNATGFSVNLVGWSLERWDSSTSTTSPTLTYYFPGELLPNGATFVVANLQNDFFLAFGYYADAYENLIVTGTGDDAYVLAYQSTDVDVYGVPGTDGSFEDWELRDSDAKRVPGIMIANDVWQAAEWNITADDDSTAHPGFRN